MVDNRKYRVAVLLSSFCIGGCENMVYELAKSFDRNNVECLVIVISPRFGTSLEKKVDKAGIKVKYANGAGKITWNLVKKVYGWLKEFSPDVLHAHMGGVFYSLPYAMSHRIKLVVTAHTTPKEAFNARTTRVLKVLAKAGKVKMVAVSEENRKLLADYYGLSIDKVEWVNNGVDLTRYYQKQHDRFTFINVGRLDKNKNQKLIIKLLSEIDHDNIFRLILCGDGPERASLEEYSKQLGIESKVQFAGNVGNVQDYLALADVYIQCSHREGLPLSTIEAAASKLPIISTNVGGMKNIVKDNGFLVEDNNEEAIKNAMISLAKNGGMRSEMGKNSYAIANDFSAITMAEKYMKIYKRKSNMERSIYNMLIYRLLRLGGGDRTV